MSEKEPKKKKHTGRNITAGVIAALLLSMGGYFGLGPGQGMLTGQGNQQSSGAQASQTQEQGESSKEESTIEASIGDEKEDSKKEDSQEEGVFAITIQEDKIVADGKEMDLATLESYLSETFLTGDNAAKNLQELSIKVKDDKAIKSTYDEVLSLLGRLDLAYTEE